jgi:hypothetical protein
MSRIPQATYDAEGGVELAFPYKRLLVDLLKNEIPAYARTYDPEEKTWWVAAPYAQLAVDLLKSCFSDARIERPSSRKPEPEPIRGTDRAFAVLHLLPTAPPALVDAAFRCLAKLHQRDRGGDVETMKRLNEARDQIVEVA